MLGSAGLWVLQLLGWGQRGQRGHRAQWGRWGGRLRALPLATVSSSAPKSHAGGAFRGSPTPRRLRGRDTVCPVLAMSAASPSVRARDPPSMRGPPSWAITQRGPDPLGEEGLGGSGAAGPGLGGERESMELVAPTRLLWHPDLAPRPPTRHPAPVRAPPDGWLKLKGNKPSGKTNARRGCGDGSENWGKFKHVNRTFPCPRGGSLPRPGLSRGVPGMARPRTPARPRSSFLPSCLRGARRGFSTLVPGSIPPIRWVQKDFFHGERAGGSGAAPASSPAGLGNGAGGGRGCPSCPAAGQASMGSLVSMNTWPPWPPDERVRAHGSVGSVAAGGAAGAG